MKKLSLFLFTALFAVIIFSCKTSDNKNEVDTLKEPRFDEAVALFQKVVPTKSLKDGETIEIVLTVDLVSFDENVPICNEYYIDSIQYTDDGQYNDLVAGDGTYTSIQSFQVNSDSLELKSGQIGMTYLHKGADFKYEKELAKYINTRYTEKAAGVSVSCKMRLVECPETSWWNTCWPLPSPCTCVEFYDCEVSVSLEW